MPKIQGAVWCHRRQSARCGLLVSGIRPQRPRVPPVCPCVCMFVQRTWGHGPAVPGFRRSFYCICVSVYVCVGCVSMLICVYKVRVDTFHAYIHTYIRKITHTYKYKTRARSIATCRALWMSTNFMKKKLFDFFLSKSYAQKEEEEDYFPYSYSRLRITRSLCFAPHHRRRVSHSLFLWVLKRSTAQAQAGG